MVWSPGKLHSSLGYSFGLEDAEGVGCWVYDPGGPGEADVGYARHFNAHWPHQGLGQLAPLDDPNIIPLPAVRIERRHAIARLIDEYRRAG
ncbi:MAG: hypothetical protein JO095_13495 [Alphaproteobacteria bacterium]|nr:hypothetical protein [Alphaproteobacteria bacterium]